MTWTLSHDLGAFREVAGAFLRSRPDRNTVLLSVSEAPATLGSDLYGADVPLFGWWRAPRRGADVAGALLWTPPHAVCLSAMPADAAAELPALLAESDPRPVSVRGEEALAQRVAAAPAGRHGNGTERLVGERLYRLASLHPPHPAPPGRARLATMDDRDRLLAGCGNSRSTSVTARTRRTRAISTPASPTPV